MLRPYMKEEWNESLSSPVEHVKLKRSPIELLNCSALDRSALWAQDGPLSYKHL